MSSIALPQSTLARLDQMSRSFLWGSTREKRKIHLIAWDRVTVSKTEGGLGIRTAKEMNKALIAKLGWRLFQVDGGLWSHILKHKYKIGSLRDQDWLNPKASWSSTWRSVCTGIREVVLPNVSWVIRDGHTTRFWLDKWILPQPLCELAVGTIPTHLKEALVCDMWQPNTGWDFTNITPYVIAEVRLLLHSKLVDSFTNVSDKIPWVVRSDGKFTVKSAYEALTCNQCPRQRMDGFFEKVWHVLVPERIRVFLWLVSHQVVLTNVERNRRRLSDSKICSVCKGGDETILHMLRDCPSISRIWSRLVPPHKLQVFREMSLLEWLFTNLGDRKLVYDIPWEMLFSVTVWWGWKWRCGTVFNTNDPCRDRVKFIRDMAMEVWQSNEAVREGLAAVTRVERLIAWKPPTNGWYKLNTNGASRGKSGLAAAGGVIRDGSGAWCGGFAFNIGICSAPLAELWGIFYGLNMTWTQGIMQLEVEVDSEMVVGFLQTWIPDSHLLSLLVHLCYGLISKDWTVRIYHGYREANRLADGLANYAYSLPLGIHQVLRVPDELNPILVDDANGTVIPRLIRT